MTDYMTDEQKEFAKQHNGETEGKCERCGAELGEYNRRYVGPNPYHQDINDSLVFMDACGNCYFEAAQDI